MQRGLHRAPVDRAGGLVLVHQLPQRLLAAGHAGNTTGRTGVVRRGPSPPRRARTGGSPCPVTRLNALTSSSVTFCSARAPIRCTVEISRSTRVSVISRSRSCSSAASSVSRQPARMVAQVRRRLHRGPRPPAGHHLRRDVGEQTRRQPDRADRAQLADLGQHRLQAHVARNRLDQRQHRSASSGRHRRRRRPRPARPAGRVARAVSAGDPTRSAPARPGAGPSGRSGRSGPPTAARSAPPGTGPAVPPAPGRPAARPGRRSAASHPVSLSASSSDALPEPQVARGSAPGGTRSCCPTIRRTPARTARTPTWRATNAHRLVGSSARPRGNRPARA